MRTSVQAIWALVLLLCAGSAAAAPALQALARSTVGEGQGVYAIAGDGTVLVSQAADHAVHPASITKIATSLALLERLGPRYRFETRIAGTGPVHAGRLAGDLIVDAAGDPFFIDESAWLVLRRLRARGLRVVEGRLLARGPLLFDWQPDPGGRRLEAALAGRASGEAWARVTQLTGSTESLRDAALVFLLHDTRPAAPAALAVHRSPPLLDVVKVLNGYSNNVFHWASDAVGGAAGVQESARLHVPEPMRAEIVIANGAGAGTENRLSPRAVVALLAALRDELVRSGHDLTAVLPVSGIDPGTLAERLPERRGVVVGKTGTSGSVGASALAGALRTPERGIVLFAVLNHGVAVPDARARQDAFARALIAATDAQPWPYTAPTRPLYADEEVE
jgi:D-alanyl-D-alanine carboxypeptidase/D-alanyl-D-alanine-endopeptidase (penicillin-binding protein 4)